MSELLEQVEKSIMQRALFRRGQKILAAVSGGVDSMVLLRLLHELARKNSWHLSVAHLNHGLRGRSSEADERLVIREARSLGLPIQVERAAVRQFAKTEKLSLEMAARKLRHDFLARTATRLNIRTIALAHHADDQVELFFLRLLRGSGGEGLAGMKWRGVSPANARIELVRPLLGHPKSALLTFARQQRIRFREDASNASLDFLRNRIRHELLPLLRSKYQPALDRTIARVGEIVGTETDFVGREAESELGPNPSRPFTKLHVAVQRRCIQLQLLRLKLAPEFELVETLRVRPGYFVKVSPDLAVALEIGGRLRVQTSQAAVPRIDARHTLDLPSATGEVVFAGVRFLWHRKIWRPRKLPTIRAGREIFDADKVGSRIVLRHWQPGDRFQPSGMKSAVKLQDLFVNGNIPQGERARLVVAQTESGEIFWVERLRIAERFKLSDATIRCLQWHWKRL